MSAETLRKAAALIRERAEDATASPWSSGLTGIYGTDQQIYIARWDDDSGTPVTADRLHIASWHPTVALTVADWLDWMADGWSWNPQPIGVERHALAVARAYLGSDA